MANLQVKDIDNNLYNALKSLAKQKRRSVSQEVIRILESYLSRPSNEQIDSTDLFLNLTWSGDESAENMVKEMRSSRKNSKRFLDSENVFD
ncbi:MAG: hypothetical protein P8X42_17320 [Calditrichaceae bacterium]|jgi:plasmid stability protein